MNLNNLEKTINESFEIKEKVGPKSDKKLIKTINETINLVDSGKIRVANKINGKWINVILKAGIANLILKYSPNNGSTNFSTTINEIIKSATPTINTAQKDERII